MTTLRIWKGFVFYRFTDANGYVYRIHKLKGGKQK